MFKNTRLTQILIAVFAVVLVALIYFAPPRKNILKSSKPAQKQATSIDQVINLSKEKLTSAQLVNLNRWEKLAGSTTGNQQIAFLDSLATSWEIFKQPYIAAHYFKEKATVDSKNESVIQSARQYFNAFNSHPDSSIRASSLKEATILFEKALSTDQNNDDLKLDLALCYVEDATNPMKGIMALRELIEKNPENENALFVLGQLSVRSGQHEKAISRFKQILELSPNKEELLLYIADCYVQLGEKDKAIVYFSRFKSKAKDKALIDEIDRYIEKLIEE